MRSISGSFLCFMLFFQNVVLAGHVKVDFDTRSDSTAAGFLSWQATHGTTQTYGDVTVGFNLTGMPASTAWKITWYNKNGLNNYELAMDGLFANFDDGTTSHPSYAGGTINLTLTGLTTGGHTFISYHNAIWPVEKYNRTIAPCKISIDGVEQLTIQPSQNVTHDANIASTFLTFNAVAGQPVAIRFEPVGNTATQICTAILNGFEIDNLASVDSYATAPSPENGDLHVNVNLDTPSAGMEGSGACQLRWTPSNFADRQNIYFGNRETAVANATPAATGIYQAQVPNTTTTWQAAGLNTRNTYYWRIDTVKADGSVTKGYLWSFRGRHLAFPTAEGYGRFAHGGRYGRIVEVTTTQDYNPGSEAVIPGSLRWAMEVEKGARIVVFRVGGVIALKQRISIPSDGGDVYVAGQTAPGEGICITRYGFGGLGTKDAVIRFIRNRVGDYCQKAMDGIGLASCDHCIVDHCSISWTLDEAHSSRSAKNITFQRNIISEALNDSYHYNDSDPNHLGTQPHAYAASISGNIGSYHHNLLAHCTQRNWSLAGGLEQDGLHYAGQVDIRNNVVYNWRDKTTDGGCKRVNFVNNYYKPGPAMRVTYLMRPGGDELSLGDMQQFYIAGNRMVGILSPETDNWTNVFPEFATQAQVRVNTPFFPSYVTTHTADQTYNDVLGNVGATRPLRDPIDARVVQEVRNGTITYYGSKAGLPGIIDSQNDAGGYPAYASGPAPADTDHDGLPDWHEAKFGTNPASPAGDFSDTNGDPDGDGYTRMDDYLEYLATGGTLFDGYNCPRAIAADINGDCRITVADFFQLAASWLLSNPAADLNHDGLINIIDLHQLALEWLNCNRQPLSACY